MTIIPLFLLCIFFIVLSKKTKLIYEKSNLIDYYLSLNRNYLIYVSETKKTYIQFEEYGERNTTVVRYLPGSKKQIFLTAL